MQKIVRVLFGLGLVLFLCVAGIFAMRIAGFDVPPTSSEAVARPSFEFPPAAFVEVERADLRPNLPAQFEYTPSVRDVDTFRMFEIGPPRRASIYDGGSGDALRPVVILLHGAGRTELSMIDMWDETADAHGLLLISLKSPDATWDPSRDDTPLIETFLNRAARDIPIDRNRVFLFGHSAGSTYAQLLANQVQGPWRAVAGHAGTLPAGWIERRFDAPPIRHYLGSNDAVFPPHDARISAEALAEHGHHSEFVLIPQHSHWFYEGGPAIAEDAWAWFTEIAE